ncbi:MAG TPA: bifunctional demethylmenaquinone methyltransferase/2-methoxy-6-polyprenyl-1,4-benzoquinol methylase, partial [Rhodospirillaceae bacterium]|nr:bifunctional demethylmenaquinone methyltransferase/2-methoxy-6-polyprenyl-1,4-benzoquinol methylase [Rhodospirillaceae bacterium]
IGRARALDRGVVSGLAWVCGDAEAIPLPERCMDAYTIAFGLRNVTHPEAAMAEAYRVLKPGGRFLCLEFSHVVLPVLDRLYDLYSFSVIPALGGAVTGDVESYRYLVESIRRFPTQKALASTMWRAGFERVSYRNLSGGIAALHSAWRI